MTTRDVQCFVSDYRFCLNSLSYRAATGLKREKEALEKKLANFMREKAALEGEVANLREENADFIADMETLKG